MLNKSKKNLTQKKDLQEEGIGFEQISRQFRIHWYMFIVFTALTCIMAWLYLRYQTPVYKVSNTILIKDEKNKQGISTADLVAKDFGFGNIKKLGDEVKIMTSNKVMEEVVKNLTLDRQVFLRGQIKNTELYADDSPIHIKEVVLKDTTKVFKASLDIISEDSYQLTFSDGTKQDALFNNLIRNKYGDFMLHKDSVGKFANRTKFLIVCKSVEKAAKDIVEEIVIELPKKESNILEPTIQSAVPEQAKDILVDMIAVYNRNNVNAKNEVTKNTLSFIESRLSSLTKEISGVENSVEKYKTREGMTSDGNSDIGYFFNRLGESDKELVKMEVQNSIFNSIEAILLKNDNNYELLPTNLELKSTNLQNQISDYNKLVLERNRLLKVAGESNPILKNINEDLKNLRKSIIGSISHLKEESNAVLAQTKSKTEQFTDKLGSIPRKERELTDIKRQQNVKEGLYLFLLQKQEETGISISGATEDARVVAHPTVGDKPLTSRKRVVFPVAILLGLFAGGVYAVIKAFLTNTVQSEDDIIAETAMPILGKIPYFRTDNNLVVQQGSRTVIGEMFRQLRAEIQYALQPKALNGHSKKGQVIMVTCTSSGEGKSFISLNLSMSLAIAAKKTVVIGLDLRRPKLSEYLSIENDKPGIAEYLENESDLKPLDIILTSEKNKDLFFIPSGEEPQDPSELIMSPKMGQLFDYLKANFEYIIIDTAPIGLVSDAFLLKPFVDMTLYIVRFGKTKLKHLNTIEKFYEGNKLNNPKIVFNGIKWDDSQEYRYKNSYYTNKPVLKDTTGKPDKKVLNGTTAVFPKQF